METGDKKKEGEGADLYYDIFSETFGPKEAIRILRFAHALRTECSMLSNPKKATVH